MKKGRAQLACGHQVVLTPGQLDRYRRGDREQFLCPRCGEPYDVKEVA